MMKPSSLLNPYRLYRQKGSIAAVLHYYRHRVAKGKTADPQDVAIQYFQSLKNKYAGRRGFVIGNGPSLRISDLDRLTNEITIASNKVYLAYNQTAWRPTFLTVVDELVWKKIKDELPKHVQDVHTPHYLDPSVTRCRVHQWRCIGWAKLANAPNNFSDDLTQGAYGGATVTYENLQFAAHLGLNPIYIIGCDHYYAGEKDVVHDQKVAANASNHFVPNYRQPGEIVNAAPIAVMNEAYACAADYAKRTGVSILNATRGGHLEAFPRCDFDRLF